MAPVPPSSSEYEVRRHGPPSHHHQARPFPGPFQRCPPMSAAGSFPPAWGGIIEGALPSNRNSLVHSVFHFFLASLVILKIKKDVSAPFVPCWPGSIFAALTAGLALNTVPPPWPWDSRVASSHMTAKVCQDSRFQLFFYVIDTCLLHGDT